MGTKLINGYSLLHFLSGIVAYMVGLNFWIWNAIHVLFEILENTEAGMALIRQIPIWPGGKDHADHPVNRIGDVLLGAIGWLLAEQAHSTYLHRSS